MHSLTDRIRFETVTLTLGERIDYHVKIERAFESNEVSKSGCRDAFSFLPVADLCGNTEEDVESEEIVLSIGSPLLAHSLLD